MKELQSASRYSRRMIRTALVCACLPGMSLFSGVQAQSIKVGDIAPFEVVYDVGNNLITAGTARLSLSKDGDLWNYSLNTKPRGVFKLAGKGRITESSTLKLTETDGVIALQPQVYQYRQDDEKRRAVDASFNWEDNSISYTYRGVNTTENFSEPVLDRLSVTLVIMNALRHNFDNAQMQVFDNGRVKAVAFINDGTELLNTPLGKIDTVRVINRNATGGSRETTTWFAPSLDYVPIKIEHRKRHELVARLSLIKLENRLKSIELESANPEEDTESTTTK